MEFLKKFRAMMNEKEKFITGIVLTIVAGTILVSSLVFAVVRISDGLFTDLASFDLKMSAKKEARTAGFFSAAGNEIVSFWLLLPDRRVENQDFKLVLTLFNEAGEDIAVWKNNFQTGFLRKSLRNGQYYRLGTHRFNADFNGKLSYHCSGKWIAPYNGTLVIQKSTPIVFPADLCGSFLFSGIIFWAGIGIIIRNRNGFSTCANDSIDE